MRKSTIAISSKILLSAGVPLALASNPMSSAHQSNTLNHPVTKAAVRARIARPSAASSMVELLLRLPAFTHAVNGETRRGMAYGLVAAVAMTLLSMGARFLLDPMLPPGFPYLTFFPSIIITGFVWGIIPAACSAVLSGLAAWYWFIPPYGSFNLDAQSVTALVFYVVVVVIDLGLLQLALHTAGSQARAQIALASALQLQQVVSEEVDHRLKNLLATVNGLISLSQKHATSPAELGEQLRQRVNAMSHSVALLRGAAHGAKTGVRDVVLSTLQPLGISLGERLNLDGKDEILSPNGIIPLNLILHELGTNSVKYGALSGQVGSVLVKWNVSDSEDCRGLMRLCWSERGGPKAVKPTRTGFGTELLNRMARSLGGVCDFEFEEVGLTVTITMNCTQMLDRDRA